MAVMRLVGAGPLAALMAAEREFSARPAGSSSRTQDAANPSPAAIGEGTYRERNVETRAASAPASRVSHSQITSDDQPARLSAARTEASRARLRSIFARQ